MEKIKSKFRLRVTGLKRLVAKEDMQFSLAACEYEIVALPRIGL